ncbi:MAG: hypothetical protein U0325_25105 [Polyangiales bacterium]
MSDRDDPPRVDAGPLAGLLRSARADGPREHERAALDAAVRAAVAVPARPGTPWRLGAVGVAGVVAAVGWMSTRPAGPPPVAPTPSAALAPPPAASPSAAPPAARAYASPASRCRDARRSTPGPRRRAA